jgi:hypothetical protein
MPQIPSTFARQGTVGCHMNERINTTSVDPTASLSK